MLIHCRFDRDTIAFRGISPLAKFVRWITRTALGARSRLRHSDCSRGGPVFYPCPGTPINSALVSANISTGETVRAFMINDRLVRVIYYWLAKNFNHLLQRSCSVRPNCLWETLSFRIDCDFYSRGHLFPYFRCRRFFAFLSRGQPRFCLLTIRKTRFVRLNYRPFFVR